MAIDERQKHYLSALGVTVWERRNIPVVEPVESELEISEVPAESVAPLPFVEHRSVATEPATENTSTSDAIVNSAIENFTIFDYSASTWTELQTSVRHCRACELAKTRTQTVFGVGNKAAEVLVIGEAPGADEDRQGEPFVGRAGQLLNEMLFAIGYAREQVYIANILKCRPPNNRDPKPEEMVKCAGFLQRQIELVQPRLIISVGRISAQHLLKTDTPIGRLRGSLHRFGPDRIPLIVTYHPAYLLRSPLEKRRAWDDLVLAKRTLLSFS